MVRLLLNKCRQQANFYNLGSHLIKAGFGGYDHPHALFPPIVGDSLAGKDPLIGDEATIKSNVLYPRRPTIQGGQINNWDEMEKILDHALSNELRIDPKQYRLLISDTNFPTHENRIKMMEVAFESLEVPSLLMMSQAPLSIFSTGNLTGLIVDSGEYQTSVVPVFSGIAMPHGIRTINFGGRTVTDFLVQNGVFNQTRRATELLKESVSKTSSWTLPGGTSIHVDNFSEFISETVLQQVINSSISSVDHDLETAFNQTTVLCGGNSYLPGFKQKLESINSNLIALADRKYSAWIGGSIIAGEECFVPENWLDKTEYAEYGPSLSSRLFVT